MSAAARALVGPARSQTGRRSSPISRPDPSHVSGQLPCRSLQPRRRLRRRSPTCAATVMPSCCTIIACPNRRRSLMSRNASKSRGMTVNRQARKAQLALLGDVNPAHSGVRVHDRPGDPYASVLVGAIASMRRRKDSDEIALLKRCMRRRGRPQTGASRGQTGHD